MPDRKLTKEELDKFIKEHLTADVFHALDTFGKEQGKPSLHDLVLTELYAKLQGKTQIIIQQGRTIKAILKHLGLKEKSKNAAI